MSELLKFDPSQLMQGVKDRVKATFVALIPDEQWDQMVKKEVDDFFSRKNMWEDYKEASPFQLLCRSVFEDISKCKIRDMLENLASDQWENNRPKMNEELRKMLIESAPDLFVNMLKNMFQNCINTVRNF